MAANGKDDASDFPLFPTIAGEHTAKTKVVASINAIVERCGLPVVDGEGRQTYGGHSFRTGGAVLLSNLGVDTTRIETLARWNSHMLLHYIRSAPVNSITREFRACAKPEDAQSNESLRVELRRTCH